MRALFSTLGFSISNINPQNCFPFGDFTDLVPDIRVHRPGLLEGVITHADFNKDLVIDVTIINPLASNYHVNNAYNSKVAKYGEACAANNLVFLPLVFEACGKFQPKTAAFMAMLYDLLASKKDEWGHHSVTMFWNRRISAIIHRNNAIAISTRFDQLTSRFNGASCLADEGNYRSTYDKQLHGQQHLHSA